MLIQSGRQVRTLSSPAQKMNSASGLVYRILLTISPYERRGIGVEDYPSRPRENVTNLVYRNRSDLQVLLTDKNCKPAGQKLAIKVTTSSENPIGRTERKKKKGRGDGRREKLEPDDKNEVNVLSPRETHLQSDVFATGYFREGLGTAYTGKDPIPDLKHGSAK